MCGFARRTRVADALLILEERITRLDSELVPVTEAAGRVAASDLHARVAVPHFRRSMMDGYAVVAESTFGGSELAPRPLLVVGEVRAGEKSPLERSLVLGEALRITTGAVLPPGADAVVMAELTLELDPTHIGVTQAVSPHKHVGAIGEDVAAGAVVVSAGRLLRPQDAGLLASVGIAMVPVIRRPRVAVIVTGNELLAPGAVPEGACIVDSNSVVLAALAQRDGAIVASIERILDDRDTLRSALERTRADVVLLSGGSSVGPEDHAPAAVRELGELAVHGVAMRPSSPAGFGFLPNSRPIFLLPGNPVSSLCAYEFFAGPTIRALGGRRRSWPHRVREARLATKLVSELGRTDYARVRFDAEGRVVPLMTSGASILSSTTLADGVVIVPDDREGYDEGELVVVSLYDDAP
ncbi:MAG: molybdopterin molybdenumtransferase MoeA [Myxococcales bacterium]|nr:molybdopterin molybdenumtransferase MoeA [Myxococcales bacterium]